MSLSALTPTVTTPAIPGTVPELHILVDRMKRLAIERDNDMTVISMVRKGKPEILFPDLFNDVWKKQITANWIDTMAREFSEMIAPLPALNCTSKGMSNVADKKQAAAKNQIGWTYWRESNLKFQMIAHADRFLTFGFAPFIAEPDYENNTPRIRCEDSIGAYYENDRDGNCLRYAKCWYETASRLAAKFPELGHLILTKLDPYGTRIPCDPEERVEVVRYIDAERWVMFLPGRHNLVVSSTPNRTKKCPVYIAERPGLFTEPSGQWRDVIWVQLARQRMALLGLEIGVKTAGAPLAVPRDVVEMAVGPDAVIQTDQPQNIRRVGIDVPPAIFQLEDQLKQELMMGGRYPEGRATGIDGSVITGRGVQALMGSFDSQIQTAQTIMGIALAKVTAFCFELDETIWPHMKKRIFGTMSGEPYDLTYVPSEIIQGDYVADVTYGYAAGLAPNQAVVMMLQLRGDGLIDRDTVRRNLPFDMNVEQMQRNMDVEGIGDALKQGLFSLLQELGPMAASGQADPGPYLKAAARIIKARQQGKALPDIFVKEFAPEALHPELAQQAGQPAGPPGADGAAPGAGAPGATGPQGNDPMAQAPPGMGASPIPGGQPSLQQLVAGISGGGQAQMSAAVRRRAPLGA